LRRSSGCIVSPVPTPAHGIARLLCLDTTRDSLSVCHLEVSTSPGRIRSRKIWSSDRSGTAIRLSGIILLTKLIRRGGSASAAG